MAKKDRPLVVSIISVLQMLIGVLAIFVGVLYTILIFTVGQAILDNLPPVWQPFFAVIGAVIQFVGIVFIIVGLLFFLLGRGLWNMKQWAWAVDLVLYLLNGITYLLDINFLLTAAQVGAWGFLFGPIVTLLLIIYFIMIRDKF
ncbi:MAG: hypothetical protein ACFFE8_05625 [Candidatus Heimdallarchaeota archaeon]